MFRKLIVWLLAGVLGLAYAGSAFAYFHLWQINEIYSNADGSVQFIELLNLGFDGETVATAAPITVTPTGGTARTFNFPSNLSGSTANKSLLIATQGFANLGVVIPDFIMQDGFVAINGGQMNLGGFDIINYPALPTNGILSINRSGVTATNSPRNFAGASGSVSPPADTQAPTVPTGLSATAVSGSQINLSWTASSDNVGVIAYQVLRGGVFHTTVNAPTVSFSDTGLAQSTTYSYAVRACDAANNCSAQSSSASATTQTPPDTQPPSVPTGLTASAVSGSQINLAWTVSTDNVAVTQYRIYRNAALLVAVTGTPPATSYSNTGLTASTAYSYTVAACDAFANCSAQSASVSATTLAAGNVSFTPALAVSWNLMGNALNLTLDVATIFGGNANIASVWKWDAATQSWFYYSPSLTAAQLTAFTDSRGYQVLATIGPGEGYWVNTTSAVTLPAQSGTEFYYGSANFAALPRSWNLIATATGQSPHLFANAMSTSPPPIVGVNASFLSLWAWDAAQQTWYYYAPALENALCSGAPCGLAGVKSYADSRGYLHFEDANKTLGIGVGFWVNRP